MQHLIGITVINSPAGVAQPEDGIMMMFLQAVAVGAFSLETPYLLTGLDDANALGINAAYDTANSTAVFQQIEEFYDEAGDGALLWIVGVGLATAYADYAATDPCAAHIRYTAQNDPAERAKMIGLCYAPPAATQSAADFPADVTAAITAWQALQETLFAEGFQFSVIIDGYNMSTAITPASIGTMATQSAPSISLCIAGTQGNGVSAVGLCLGRFSAISIGHGLGCVKDGPRNTSTAYLTNGIALYVGDALTLANVYTVAGGPVIYNGNTYQPGQPFTVVGGHLAFTVPAGSAGYVTYLSTPVQSLKAAYVNQLGLKQYLFLRTWMNHSGFYWNDGATCEDPTLMLSTQEYNRVANSLSASALSFFIDQIGQNEPLDVATGAISQTVLNALQSQFYVEDISPLTVANGSGDITDAALILSAPNFNANKTINFKIKIVPTPIMGGAEGTVEFDSTL